MDDVKSTINTEQLKSNSSWPLSRLIGEGSIALTAITALLFLIGWFYLAGFYDYFSLDVTALDLPPSASFIAALGPLGGLFIGIQKPIYALLIIALSLIFYKTVANTYWMR